MNFFGHDWAFWAALIGASAIKVMTSPYHSFFRAVVMVITSVFIAWLLTDPVVDFLKLDPGVYKAAVGGLLALTADGLVRLLLTWASNPGELVDLVNRLRGKK